MDKITKLKRIDRVAQSWRAQYPTTKEKTYKRLKALPKDATEEDVVAIIGNSSWTRCECDECGKDVSTLIQLGQEPDYESSTATVCEDCLKRALKMIREEDKKCPRGGKKG